MKTSLTSTLTAIAFWFLAGCASANAQTVLYWDSNTSSADGFGGGGIQSGWTAARLGWFNGAANQAWADGSVAVFAGPTSGTANLSGSGYNPKPLSLIFSNVSGYVISAAATPQLTVTSGNIHTYTDATISAPIINAAGDTTTGITKWGAARLTLAANNPLIGGITVREGTLAISDKQSIGGLSQPLTINGGTLELSLTANVSDRLLTIGDNHATINVVSSSDAWTFQMLQGGNGTLTKTGAGKLSFTGTTISSRTGATIVNDGTLSVGNTLGSAIGSGPVTVNAGGTLAGNGIVGGAVTVTGTIAPGSSPGTLTLQSDLSLAAAAQLNFDLATQGIAGGGINDLITVAGDLTLDGTLNLNGLAGFGVGTYELIDYSGSLLDNGLELGTLSGTADNSFQFDIQAGDGKVNLFVTQVPEPGVAVLAGTGAVAVWLRLRRRHSPPRF